MIILKAINFMLGGFFEGFGKIEKREQEENDKKTGKTIEEMEAYVEANEGESVSATSEYVKSLEEDGDDSPGIVYGTANKQGWDKPLGGIGEEKNYRKGSSHQNKDVA